MIRGYLDFSALDAQARIALASPDEHALRLPGLELQWASAQLYHNERQLLLVQGEPTARDARLLSTLNHEGWPAVLPWITASPHNIVPQLGGRFSLFWLDVQTGSFGFATDRFATHAMCYAVEGRRVAFADRADAVPAQRREIAPQALFEYLHFHMIPAPRTIFEGVLRLPPASLFTAKDGQTQWQRWWTPHFEEPKKGNVATEKQAFRNILDEAVRRAAGPGEVGAFLSGGTDSSTVAGMLAAQRSAPIKAYSIGFDAAGYDEMEYARIAAKHFGLEHRIHYVTPEEVALGIPQVAAHYDQPFGNSSAVPAFYCARMAHDDGISRLMAGDGGDELFGGNTRYADQRLFAPRDRMPEFLWRGAAEPLLHVVGSMPGLRKIGRYAYIAGLPVPQRLDIHNLLTRLGHDEVLEAGLRRRIDPHAPMALRQQVWDEAGGRALINRMLAFDWRFTLADNDLPKVLGTAELAGVSVGFPLIDDDLLDFSMTLPPRFKLRGTQLRWFFKKALLDFLPRRIVTKQKHGFGLPFGQWALQNDALRAMAGDSLDSLAARGIMRADFLRSLMGERVAAHPGYYGEMVWIAMMLEQWLRAHAPDYRLSAG
ncbi:MAG: asparagine synthase C-terminal domain-containing protein [Rhodocyclaceae bacterium]